MVDCVYGDVAANASEMNVSLNVTVGEVRKEMFYLMTHSTHFIYGYMASDHSDK